ncbi:V-type ATP synthase subunit K [Candidatus Magnetoovum chiemensis]|nr:V-type ATP synthase subunit K [Candidatus Magnetoovum chiemensis]
MNAINSAPATVSGASKLFASILGGIALGVSAWYQGKAGACACDAMGETEKGFANYIMVIGIIETVALFVMVFLMTTLR